MLLQLRAFFPGCTLAPPRVPSRVAIRVTPRWASLRFPFLQTILFASRGVCGDRFEELCGSCKWQPRARVFRGGVELVRFSRCLPLQPCIFPSAPGNGRTLRAHPPFASPDPPMSLSLRFVLPLLLVLAAVAYGVTQLAHRVTRR